MINFTEKQNEARKLLASEKRNVLLYGGSRSGKSLVICHRMIANAIQVPCRQVVMRRNKSTINTSIGMDTIPKIIRSIGVEDCITLSKPPSGWVFSFKNCPGSGSEIHLLGLDDHDRADKILGLEFSTIFINEASEVPWHSVQVALTRLAQSVKGLKNRAYFDCNPTSKRHWLYRLFIEGVDPDSGASVKNGDDYGSVVMNPTDNIANLPEGYIDGVLEGFSGKKRSRFLLGEFTDDNENALWKMQTMIAPFREDDAPEFDRVIISVDPAVTANSDSDETGIIVTGSVEQRGFDHIYVTEDHSGKYTVEQWANIVCGLYRSRKANMIVAETNQGGDLVKSAIRNAGGSSIPVVMVHAKRSKRLRAEDIAQLYDQGRVHHCGEFPDLEDEMCNYTGAKNEDSPNRLDALVYGCKAHIEPVAMATGGTYSW